MDKLKALIKPFKSNGIIKIVIILGVVGMLLILLSEVLSNKDSNKDQSVSVSELSQKSEDNFSAETEKKLRQTLEKIEGVGKAEVMVTVGGTSEYVYAREEKTRSGEKDSSSENEYVLIGSNGEKQALLQKILTPEIKGVAVVCEGGDSNVVKEKIYSTLSALLGLSSDKIYIAKLG